MKRLLAIVMFLAVPLLAHAQKFRSQGWCQYGGQTALVQGLPSTNDLMGSYPGCQIDVYAAGTGTHATLYLNSAGSLPLANPFTADITTGYFGFYADTGCYDIVTSGAGMPLAHTDSDVCLNTSAGVGTVTSVSVTNNATGLISTTVNTPTTTPNIVVGLTQFGAHQFWGNSTGSTATPTATVIGVADLPFTYTGNTTKLVTAGTISGTGSPLCTDASGNATTSGCVTVSAYSTIQDEGSNLTQRTKLNFIGSSVTCADNAGTSVTDCTFTSSGGITGTGTNGNMMVWGPGNTAVDSSISVNDSVVTYLGTTASFTLKTSNSASSAAKGITIQPGSGTTGAVNGGLISLVSGGTSGGSVGAINLVTPNASGGTPGDILLQPGTGNTFGGNIHLNPGIGSVTGGLLICNDQISANSPGCSMVVYAPGGATAAGFVSGSGVPSGSCQVPLSHPGIASIPVLYLRTNPSDASSFLYVCVPASTWTPILSSASTVPTYSAGGTLRASSHSVADTGTLSGGTLTVTLTGSAVFTSNTTYFCTATDRTAANVVWVTKTSGSSVTFTGTGTDVFDYQCVGN